MFQRHCRIVVIGLTLLVGCGTSATPLSPEAAVISAPTSSATIQPAHATPQAMLPPGGTAAPAAPSAVPTLPTSAAQVFFVDDFSRQIWWSQSSTAENFVEYRDNQLVLGNKVDNYMTYTGPHTSHDKDDVASIHIDVEARVVAGSEKAQYGIICNYQDDSNFYFLETSADGYYVLGGRINNELHYFALPSSPLDHSTVGAQIPQYIGADCGEGRLTLYVNGTPIASVEDTTLPAEYLPMLIMESGAKAEVAFDNFRVTQRTPSAPPSLSPPVVREGILYTDDFSDSALWFTDQNDLRSIRYSAGTLGFEIKEADRHSWTTPMRAYAYPHIHVAATVNFSPDSSSERAGIVCGMRGDVNYYELGVAPDGSYGIQQIKGTQKTWLLDPTIVAPLTPLDPTKPMNIGADCGNGILRLYRNDSEIATVDAPEFQPGGVGVFAQATNKDYLKVDFDNFVVTALK